MTDQELARALFEAGLLTQEQVQTAAAQRTPTQNFAQVVVNLGWVSPAQIAQFDPNALGIQTLPPMPSAPVPTAPVPNYGVPGYGAPTPRRAEVRIDAIGDAWKLVSAQLGTWVGAMLIFFVASAVLQSPVYFATFSAMRNAAPGTPPEVSPLINLWSYGVGLLLSAFFMPGLYKMALKQIDGQPISIGDVFSGLPYIGNALLALVLTYIAIGLGVLACCVGAFVAAAGLAFALPLIVDKNLSATEALSQSWNTLKSHILPMILLLIVTGLCSALGMIACGVGLLVTYPLLFVTPMLVYRDFFPADGSNAPQDQGNYPPPPIPSPF